MKYPDLRAVCETASNATRVKFYLDRAMNPSGVFVKEGVKLPLDQVLLNSITSGGETSKNSLIDSFIANLKDIPSEPALSKARYKVSYPSMRYYMDDINAQLARLSPAPLEQLSSAELKQLLSTQLEQLKRLWSAECESLDHLNQLLSAPLEQLPSEQPEQLLSMQLGQLSPAMVVQPSFATPGQLLSAQLEQLSSMQLGQFLSMPTYALYDVDGTDFPFESTYAPETAPYAKWNGRKWTYDIHATALYNQSARRYEDCVYQPQKKKNEIAAACMLIDQFKPRYPNSLCKNIFALDRGFESYQLIAHAQEHDVSLLLRVKDINSTGILGSLKEELPIPSSATWDIDVQVALTRSRSKGITTTAPILRVLDKNTKFDYLKRNSKDVYILNFRVVRINLGNGHYECLITTLPRDEFSPSKLKKLYAERWDIEVSFRRLKYVSGALYVRSENPESVKNELIGFMLSYNLTEYMMQCVVKLAAGAHGGKYSVYQANFSDCTHLMRMYLIHREIPIETVAVLMAKSLIPKRPNRPSYPRHESRRRRHIYHTYRVA